MFVEINLMKKKWLLSCSYNLSRNDDVNHMKNISIELDQFSATYNILIPIENLNIEPDEDNMPGFLNIYTWKIF